MTTEQCPVALPAPETVIQVKVSDGEDPRRKARLEGYFWKFMGAEKGEDGHWYAVLTREEPNSLDDVMNGTGTGLGSYTVTERAQLTD